MELIIEVDKKYYEACKDAVKESYPSQIEEIIANGTPYNPTGDLISREALKKEIFGPGSYGAYEDLWDAVRKAIDNAPAVQQNWRFYYDHGYAQAKRDFERPQGKWDFYEDDSDDTGMAYYRCSVCGRLIHTEEAKLLKNYPFCHCGAAMQTKENLV